MGRLLIWDRDGALRPVAIQSDEGQSLLAEMPEAQRLRSMHAVDAARTVHSGGAGIPLVAGTLPGGKPIAFLAQRLQPVARLVYDAVAANRGRLDRLIPDRGRARAEAVLARRLRD